MVRVLTNDPRDPSSIPGQVIPKTKKHLRPPCLSVSISRYRSRVSGAIQGKEWYPPLHFGVEAVEKRSLRVLLKKITHTHTHTLFNKLKCIYGYIEQTPFSFKLGKSRFYITYLTEIICALFLVSLDIE